MENLKILLVLLGSLCWASTSFSTSVSGLRPLLRSLGGVDPCEPPFTPGSPLQVDGRSPLTAEASNELEVSLAEITAAISLQSRMVGLTLADRLELTFAGYDRASTVLLGIIDELAGRDLDRTIPVQLFTGYLTILGSDAIPRFEARPLGLAITWLREQVRAERRIGYFPLIASMVLQLEAQLDEPMSLRSIRFGGLEAEINRFSYLIQYGGLPYAFPDHFGVLEMALTWSSIGTAPIGISTAPRIDYDDLTGKRVEYWRHDSADHLEELLQFLALPATSPARVGIRRLLANLAAIEDDNELELQLFLLFFYSHEQDRFLESLVYFDETGKWPFVFDDPGVLRQLLGMMSREGALYHATPLAIRPILDDLRARYMLTPRRIGIVYETDPAALPIIRAVERFRGHFNSAFGIKRN